ncbi:MAG TPA: transposase [Pelobium sp.]|nr:transposase [Pelobium sp.]
MDKFQNKYRISSTRLQGYDYGQNGAYFITICTQNRVHYFGEIKNGEMILNEMGKLAETEWLKTFEIRPDMNLELGAFVVMPNHFHAIIIIGDNEYNCTDAMQCRGAMHCASTTNDETAYKNKFAPQSKNLASIIRGFKSSVTTAARKIHADFAWQPRFYDHIIRNAQSYERIKNYILNNPKNWKEDKFLN